MSDDCDVFAFDFWQREDTTHGGELFAGEAAHNAGLTEERLDGGIAAGDGSSV